MGYRLKVFDAYRPQTAVTQFMRWVQDADDIRMQAYFYPETESARFFAGLHCRAFRPQPRQHGRSDAVSSCARGARSIWAARLIISARVAIRIFRDQRGAVGHARAAA